METVQDTAHVRQREIILTSLTRGATRADACRSALVPRRTFYNWIADTDFREKVEIAEQRAISYIEGLVFQCAEKAFDDPRYQRSLALFVKCRAGWSEKAPPRPTGFESPAESPAQPAPPAAPDPGTGDGMPPPHDTATSAPAPVAPVGAQHAAPSSPADQPESAEKPHQSVPSVPSAPAADEPPIHADPASSIQNPQSKIQNQSAPPPGSRTPADAAKEYLKSRANDPNRLNWRSANRNRNKSKKR